MTYRTVTVDVEVDLYDIDTDDLCDELESRGYVVSDKAVKGVISDKYVLDEIVGLARSHVKDGVMLREIEDLVEMLR